MNISKNWKIYELPIDVFDPKEIGRSSRELSADLPCDVHMPLIAHGVIEDPVDGMHSCEQEWIEDRSWWFVRELDESEYDLSAEMCELVIESIDTYGEIYLNGDRIGIHKNVNVPFVCDIKEYLKPSHNVLMIRVTTGLEQISDEDLEVFHLSREEDKSEDFDGSYMPKRNDNRRAFIRRPQYSTGWDWMPRMTTCGITGRAYIHCYSGAIVRQLYLHTVSLKPETAVIQCKAEIELCDMFRSADGDIAFSLYMGEQKITAYEKKDVFLKSGYNSFIFEVEVPQPKIWWPNGMGEQPVYQAKLSVTVNGITNVSKTIRLGICMIELDTSRIEDHSRNFAFLVNGIRIFCKGANWVPADAIYARVSAAQYTRLVEEAKEANFNMLRLWGGGIYEPDCFFDACLENGILLWQDLMFSCAHYPDHKEDFLNECRKEIEYQTKRLRNYSNLALLCGNNEIHLHQSPLTQFRYDFSMNHKNTCGYYIFNNLAAEIVEKNCPHIAYWNSSPYGGNMPNSSEVGDQHYWWPVSIKNVKNPMVEPMSYDLITSNFVSEYGCMAPLSIESMREYSGDAELEMKSKLFRHHVNSFENGMILDGIEQNYRDTENISLEDYILYGQMMQSVMYQYSLESMRFNDRCDGALFWMYHDVWGENGWSIVDYYMRRKASYYGVKRALAPVRAIFRQQAEDVCLKIINETSQEIRIQAHVGFISYDGERNDTELQQFKVPPYSCKMVYSCKAADVSDSGTLFFIPSDTERAEMTYWYRVSFRELRTPKPCLHVDQTADGDNTMVTVRSDSFAHGVHFSGDYYANDNYFDMYPGMQKSMLVYQTKGKPLTIKAVSLQNEYHKDFFYSINTVTVKE